MPVDPKIHSAVAKTILREIPLAHVNAFLNKVPAKVDAAKLEGGNVCGVGCGGAAALDQHGHTELTHDQLAESLNDKAGLKHAIAREISGVKI